MKNKLVKIISIIVILGTIILAIAYNIFQFNGKNIIDLKESIFLELDKNNITKKSSTEKKSSDKENVLSKTPEEENKKVDRSKTIDSNKIESIIKNKIPYGRIINLEFKNDSNNPHYEVGVVSKNIKYKFEISSENGYLKEVKKETLEAK